MTQGSATQPPAVVMYRKLCIALSRYHQGQAYYDSCFPPLAEYHRLVSVQLHFDMRQGRTGPALSKSDQTTCPPQ